MAPLDCSLRTLVVVTGASRGIGASIAVELAKKLTNSVFALVARSEEALEDVKSQIVACGRDHDAHIIVADLANPSLENYNILFSNIPMTNLKQAIICHNAGQVGTLDKTTTLTDLNQWRSYFDINLFSVSLLNSCLLSIIPADVQRIVVNISSLCGSVPFNNMAMYGSGKAARNLFFKVLAVEEADITVLNYSPGPVDTEMVAEVICNMKDDKTRSEFVELKATKQILQPHQTVQKMIQVLEAGAFKSGDVVDYYDRAI